MLLLARASRVSLLLLLLLPPPPVLQLQRFSGLVRGEPHADADAWARLLCPPRAGTTCNNETDDINAYLADHRAHSAPRFWPLHCEQLEAVAEGGERIGHGLTPSGKRVTLGRHYDAAVDAQVALAIKHVGPNKFALDRWELHWLHVLADGSALPWHRGVPRLYGACVYHKRQPRSKGGKRSAEGEGEGEGGLAMRLALTRAPGTLSLDEFLERPQPLAGASESIFGRGREPAALREARAALQLVTNLCDLFALVERHGLFLQDFIGPQFIVEERTMVVTLVDLDSFIAVGPHTPLIGGTWCTHTDRACPSWGRMGKHAVCGGAASPSSRASAARLATVTEAAEAKAEEGARKGPFGSASGAAAAACAFPPEARGLCNKRAHECYGMGAYTHAWTVAAYVLPNLRRALGRELPLLRELGQRMTAKAPDQRLGFEGALQLLRQHAACSTLSARQALELEAWSSTCRTGEEEEEE